MPPKSPDVQSQTEAKPAAETPRLDPLELIAVDANELRRRIAEGGAADLTELVRAALAEMAPADRRAA